MKKLDFLSEDKENMSVPQISSIPHPTSEDMKKPITEIVKTSTNAAAVVPGIKDFEADEPLLQENPNRFVLFPLK